MQSQPKDINKKDKDKTYETFISKLVKHIRVGKDIYKFIVENGSEMNKKNISMVIGQDEKHYFIRIIKFEGYDKYLILRRKKIKELILKLTKEKDDIFYELALFGIDTNFRHSLFLDTIIPINVELKKTKFSILGIENPTYMPFHYKTFSKYNSQNVDNVFRSYTKIQK